MKFLILLPYLPTCQQDRCQQQRGFKPGFRQAGRFEVGSIGIKHQSQKYKKRTLRQALKQCQFKYRKTAMLLDLSYDQLRGYLRKYVLRN